MLTDSGGAIVNISAGKALRGDVDTTAYSASKAALNALTRSVATIYGERGIRCNAIGAGPNFDGTREFDRTSRDGQGHSRLHAARGVGRP